nr:hypothetical protein [Tanacetum cinerariifolium]
MGMDTVQLETAVNTISHEYLLEFTSEYDIPETLHPELPGPGDRIVDFPEGKQKAREEYSPMLHHATRLSQKLEQSLLLGRRESVSDHMDLFNLICAPNPTKVKTGSRPRTPHEVPLLTLTANRVIEMDDPTAATDSSGVPSTIEKSPLDFSLEAGASDQETAAPEMPPSEDVPATVAPGTGQAEEVTAADPPAAVGSRKRGCDGIDVNAPPKSLRRGHADPRPSGSSHRGKSLAAIQLGLASTVSVPEDAPTGVSDPDPLSFADPPARPPADVSQSSLGIAVARDTESENASSPAEVGCPRSVYRPECGVTNGSLLDTPEACQDLVDHAAPPGYFSGKWQYGHSNALVSNEHLSQQVSTLQEQVSGEEKLKAAFEEFKRYEDDRVERRCAELDVRLDALRIDFDEELYPHMLTAIAYRMWVIGHGLRLAMMKYGESLDMRQAFADVVSARITKALQALKDLKYHLLDQLEGLKDAPIDAYKEEMKLADAIAENISHAEKKRKCRIVCRTHEVGSAHHARFDGVPVSVPTVVPQGLGLLLAEAAMQTECKDT